MAFEANENTNNNRPIDHVFESVKQYMTVEEIENLSEDENRFALLLSMILHRYKTNRKYIESLTEIVDAEWKERLSKIDENIQVSHFFYQSALCQFNDEYKVFTEALHTVMKNLNSKQLIF